MSLNHSILRFVLLACLALTFLAGCGNKSDLYLPNENTADPLASRIAQEREKQRKQQSQKKRQQAETETKQ